MRRPVAVVHVLGTLLCLGLSVIARGQTTIPAATQAAGKPLAITVTDAKTAQPLKGVTLKVQSGGKDTQTTDDTGVATLRLAEKQPNYVYITARKDGYVPMRLMWRRTGGENPAIPAAYSLAMQPGTKIGGKVLDDAGKPIPGATVVIAIRNKGRDAVEAFNVSYEDTKADAEGNWSYAQAPAEFERIDVGAWHHDCDCTQGFFSMNEFEPISALRDGSAKLTLTRGQTVEGVVYGSDGKPLAKATVGVGRDRVASNVIPAIKTDEQGHFAFGAKPGVQVVVTVKAQKHAPELKEFLMGEKPQHLDIHLTPGNTIEGKIVDTAGKPIQGVSLYTDTWRGHRTIDTRINTDKDGHFVWKSAPADAVMMDIYKMGYADDRKHAMTASTQPVVVTLNKPLRVAGKVIDAETSQPVADFTVIHGITWDNGQRISWERQGAGTAPLKPKTPGKFEFEQSYPYPGYALRVEAPGYEPADSRVYTMDERNVELTFKLTKGQPLTGVILAPDGKPAAKANVQLATKDSQAQLTNGRPDSYAHQNITTNADADGKFTLTPVKEDFLLVIVHESGQARLTKEQWKSANGGPIKLEPWAKIEGTLKIGAKPGMNEQISLWLKEEMKENAPRLWQEYKVKCDETGHYVFDRVFPGNFGVQHYIQLGPQTWGGALSKSTVAEAGKTSTVNLGGTGRPVVGRINLPASMPERWVVQTTTIMSAGSSEKPPLPDNFESLPMEERKAAYAKWLESDAGKAFKEKSDRAEAARRFYSFRLGQDGSFRVEDVEPGTYTLSVGIAQPPVGSTCGWGDSIGSATAEFTIPQIPGGRTDQPFEIPSVEFKQTKSVKVGDVAPAFSVKTLDGKDISLADFKGKYVVLDFWATWCGPCVAETPHLKSVYETFSSDPRFAMISLSLDEKTDEPKKFVEKEQIKWPQAFLGEWSKATLPNDYGVHGIPSIWLIGPDGKVLAKDLRGAVMKSEINKLMPK